MAMTTTLLDVRPLSASSLSSPFISSGRAGIGLQKPLTISVSGVPCISIRCSAQVPEKQACNLPTQIACGLCAAATIFNICSLAPSASAAVKLPPLSTDPGRCERAFVGNTIGQANGVADKLLDLRFCDYTNDTTNLKGKTLSAALMSDAKFDGADMTEVTMSKAYAVGASFKGANFTNAILDRVVFDGSNLQGANFKNAVLSGSTFDNAKLEDSNFEDALIGYVDLQKLCKNTTLSEDARAILGCRN
ncbi:hypothetical protein KP509_38G025800 [Ceratopteris richardii]|uniref:Thylakoid lumenal 17.4 kDa protein, chloroplastic n=1 Tax=Ceratopteris richardii TaxID=49495 RepID=A0A8T2Q334_CERRI|nr:hypothetical protein KP509_38G025800 [Ceratopteris richardii]